MTRYRLKAWADPDWQRRLSKTVTVSRVDEDIPTDRQKPHRKPWFIAITQKPDLLTEVGDVGLPAGNTLLLTEHDVVALVRYLLEPQTVLWSENPSPSEPGDYECELFLQPRMVAVTDSGQLLNGEAHWTPEYFTQQPPITKRATRKIHTLPWKMKTTKPARGRTTPRPKSKARVHS